MGKFTFGLSAVLTAALVGGCVGAGMVQVGTAHAAGTDQAQAITVYVDATFGFRKNHMARELSKSHAEYAAKGYHYVDMEAYDENGDLQGFFVTYARN